VDIALGPLPIKNDRVVLAVVRDFTERRKIQKEIEHLASFPRLNPSPLVEVDFSGKITFCNSAAAEVLKELNMEGDCAVFLPHDLNVFLDALSRKDAEQSLYREVPVKRRIFAEHISRVPGMDLVRMYMQDITERKRAEEAVEEKQIQLEAANKELESFSYSVSHDLRAPLGIIRGFSDMVLEDHAERLNDEGRKLLESIRRTTLRMDELIRALLDLSKVGRQEMHLRDINMLKLAKEVFDEILHDSSVPAPRLEIKPLPPAHGDSTLMRQVFANLLSNAVKFTRHKEAPAIEVGGWTEDKENVYCVKDNGVGFDPSYADKLFGTFQRLHTKKEFEGTGVGLSIVQRIVARHGGRVWAEGKPNEGAKFCFSLPRV
jgi:signal transduction histidine kinase